MNEHGQNYTNAEQLIHKKLTINQEHSNVHAANRTIQHNKQLHVNLAEPTLI